MNEMLLENRSKRNLKKRDLTAAFASRWYRPPEVIFFDRNYN